MKKFIVALTVLVFGIMTSTLMAQDIVYLKNGSIIKGSVLEIITDQNVKIQTSDGSLFVYKMDEVDRIEHDSKTRLQGFDDDFLERGFRGLLDVGAHFGFDDAEDNYQVSASFTGGYQFNQMLFVGAGVAPTLNMFDNDYYDEVETTFLLPIYAAFRMDFINKKISPFINGRIGYYINTEDVDYGGLYFYAGLGVRLKKISLSTGYDYYGNDGNAVGFATLRCGYEF